MYRSHVRTLRKVKLTFNEDEIWVLYRLSTSSATAAKPTPTTRSRSWPAMKRS